MSGPLVAMARLFDPGYGKPSEDGEFTQVELDRFDREALDQARMAWKLALDVLEGTVDYYQLKVLRHRILGDEL